METFKFSETYEIQELKTFEKAIEKMEAWKLSAL